VLKFYNKAGCTSCKKAKAYLDRRGLDYESVDITQTPPTREMLLRAMNTADPKTALNARSGSYRRRELTGRDLTVDEVLALMASDPNLIRRPFFADGERVLQGFEPAVFEKFLG
jgi:arsenate reductase (glutaredoxin)